MHAKQLKQMKVAPASGMRRPNIDEFHEGDQRHMRRIAELVNYKRLTVAAASKDVIADGDQWLGFSQKLAIPKNLLALAAAARGGPSDGCSSSSGGGGARNDSQGDGQGQGK